MMGDAKQENIKGVTEIMVQDVRNGHKQAANQIILLHLPMAKRISKSIARHHMPSRKPGIEGAGLLGVVVAVKRAPMVMYNNIISPYIATHVRKEIQEFLEHDHLVHIPRGEFKKLIEKHENINFIPLYYRSTPAYVDDSGEYRGGDFEHLAKCSVTQYHDDVEIADTLQAIKATEYEKKIVMLRLKNYTLEEIGNRLGTSAVTIHNYLIQLQKKWRHCSCVQ